MASEHQNLSEYNKDEIKSAKGFRFGIVTAQWNNDITFSLRDGCIQSLKDNGCEESDIISIEVPGAFELTLGAKYILEHKEIDAVICLGCIIKGATKHDEYIAIAVGNGITQLNLDYQKPVIFGVLTPNNHKQALERAGGKHGNKGIEAGVTAIQMVQLKAEIKS